MLSSPAGRGMGPRRRRGKVRGSDPSALAPHPPIAGAPSPRRSRGRSFRQSIDRIDCMRVLTGRAGRRPSLSLWERKR
jgi:hypothetical protein